MRKIGRNNSYTVEEIKQYLTTNNLGINLISVEYKNAHTKLEFKCNTCNYQFKKLFKDIQTRGIGCSSCSKNGEKVTTQDIINRLEEYDYRLVSNIQGDSVRGSMFTVECFRGHQTNTTWRNFNTQETKRGGVCKQCVEEGFNRDRRKCIREYHQNLKDWNYIYEGDLLTHTTDRRIFICENGHERSITFFSLKVQPNCPECRGFVRKYTEEDIKNKLSDINITYIDGYKNIKSRINIKCHCGEFSHGYVLDILKLGRCRECGDRKPYTFEERIEYYNINDCHLLEVSMKNHREQSVFKCKCGKIDEKTWDAFKRNPSCKDCSQLNRPRGENHPCWNPELTDEERLRSRKYPEYKEWRLSVYERDNYTCQCCGDDKGGNLEAHHILNHHSHEHLRLDVDNGCTLCNTCHVDFHMTYGFTNNNREQLSDHINNFNMVKNK